MTRWQTLLLRLGCGILIATLPTLGRGQHTLSFSTTDIGVRKAVDRWGIDTAWPNYDNVRQSIAQMGQANVDEIRVTFSTEFPLTTNANGTYSLGAAARAAIDNQLALAALAGPRKALTLVPTVGANDATTDAMYRSGSGINAEMWTRLIQTTQEYIQSRPGFTTIRIAAIEPFNEPDWWPGQGDPAALNEVITRLKALPAFAGTEMLAGSTLSSTSARWWYDRVPAATVGSSHLLGGSLSAYVDFIKHVQSTGKPFVNPELHSLGEAIVGAEYGMVAGTWWADVLRARGLFVQASDGMRLAYAEDLGRQSAAAVYRAPNGGLYAFAGGIERFGAHTSYRFVSTDSDTFFNGIPVREFMLQTKWDETASDTDNDFANYGSWSNQGAYAEIDTKPSSIPPLDGFRWKIVSTATGQVMEVADGGLTDGALIRSATDTGGLTQKWDIIRTRNGYYELFNANSGRTAEVADWSLVNGASVRQWGTADHQGQQWLIEDAGGGNVFLRNAYSNKYLTANPSNALLYGLTGSTLQKWRFVLANPTDGPVARYSFPGSVADSTGAANGTAFGAPAYGTGPEGSGTAIRLDGVNDYVQLPASVSQSTDITISALVKWDGGQGWQRLFDFGNDTNSYMFLTPDNGNGMLRFAISEGGFDAEERLETAALPVGEWVQLTLSIGGQTGILYLDGKPRVAGQILLDPARIAPTLNFIGKSQFADPLFKGSIADFRVYDYALHMSQVASLIQPCWNGNESASWSASAANWLVDAAPSGSRDGDDVMFNDLAANFTVNVTDPVVQPGSVTFDHSYYDYTLAGGGSVVGATGLMKRGLGTLTIRNTNTFTGPTLVEAGTLTIASAGAVGASPVTVASGATLAIAPGTTMRAPLVRLSSGTLSAASIAVRAGTGITRMAIEGGNLTDELAVSIGAGGRLELPDRPRLSLVLGGLTIDGAAGGLLDLGAGEVTIGVGGATAAGLRQALIAGRNGGTWDGTSGIVSAAVVAAGGTRTIGYVAAADGSARISYAAPGDVNLNGQVDVFDLVSVNAGGRYGTGQAAVWTEGDINYDGVTNVFDLVEVNAGGAYGAGDYLPATVSMSSLPAGAAVVPEPGLGLAVAVGAVAGAIAISLRDAHRRLAIARARLPGR